jgi:hypothetical protein
MDMNAIAAGQKELAHAWRESKVPREFAAALAATITSTADLSENLKSELRVMVDWTTPSADHLDPLTEIDANACLYFYV